MKKILLISLILSAQSAFADLITNDIIMGCDSQILDNNTDNITNMFPIFSLQEYTCNSNEFLPAYTEGCRPCPQGYTCLGGTYNFNKNTAQGIRQNTLLSQSLTYGCSHNLLRTSNNTTNMFPVWTPNVHECAPGYYLPANVDGCAKCNNDNYCPGGTYAFNETIDQGITSCPDEHPFSPSGMWQPNQCGRKLHVDNNIIYIHQSPANPTEHRLFIRYQNNIYSANTVMRDVNSDTFPKMSENAQQGLHIIINNKEYLVCDDSVPECRND